MEVKSMIKALRAGNLTPAEIIREHLLVVCSKGEAPGINTRISEEVIKGVIKDFESWGGQCPPHLVRYDQVTDTIRDGMRFRKKHG